MGVSHALPRGNLPHLRLAANRRAMKGQEIRNDGVTFWLSNPSLVVDDEW